jgi:hypothetical protein
MGTTRLVTLFAGALALSGCKGSARPCAPAVPPVLEVRDASGALELALKKSAATADKGPTSYDVCDPAHKRVGTILSEPATLTLLDGSGGLVLRFKIESPTDASAVGPAGPRLRLHREPNEARVLKPDGVPIGAISPKEGGGANVFDPASRPIALVDKRDKDLIVSDTTGTTKAFVVPSNVPVAAGVFALEGLTLQDKLAIYLVWSR